jgi:trk system potassium uptake protein TrkH
MILGACGGSTCGGFKISRVMILGKTSFDDLKKITKPRAVISTKFENEPLAQETVTTARLYFFLWILIVFVVTLILSLEGTDILTNLTASITCISNVGPGLSKIGPSLNFAFFSPYSKILLSFVMLAGRLEIIPLIILFNPKTWKKN